MSKKEKVESLETFYKRKLKWVPENLKNEIGHFNVFKFKPIKKGKPNPIPYSRRDFFKVTLIKGKAKIYYADQVRQIDGCALFFSNPHIPYKWEGLEDLTDGYYCIFNQDFFYHFGDLLKYEVFQTGSQHVFEINDKQFKELFAVFEKMYKDLDSDYSHKYDLQKNRVYELIHFANQLQPSKKAELKFVNASQRITGLFLELLERQFPIDQEHQQVKHKTPSDFAKQLAVHVNHLNKAIKEVTQKTTTQIIAERYLREAKILLKHSIWNVSEIAFALGFNEVTHFNYFFKKYAGISPMQFRKN